MVLTPDHYYFEESESQVEVEPLESEPLLKKQRTDDGSVFKSLSKNLTSLSLWTQKLMMI